MIFYSIEKDELKKISFTVPKNKDDQKLLASEIKEKFNHAEQMRQAALQQKEAVED